MSLADAAVFLLLAIIAIAGVLTFVYELSLFTLPPFVPAPKSSLAAVVRALDLRPGLRVIDLGCGDGRVLETALAAVPGIAAAGVDRNHFPLWLARLRLGRRAELRREDFFTTPLAGVDRVYLYCWPTVLEKLLPKFERELKPGARVVSADFALKNRPASRTIAVPGPQKRVRTLYVYDF